MDVTKAILCAVGVFYAFAGYVATRAALTSHFIDRAIAAIECKKPGKVDTAQSYWLLSAAAVVLAGGMALTFLLDVALWLFLASAAGQALYLFVVAPRYFDVEDPTPDTGRRQSTNAFVIYLVATAFVAWGASANKLTSVAEAGWLAMVPAAAVAAHIAYVVWMLATPPSKSALSSFGPGDDASALDLSQSRRIKVMADYHTHPLWALDTDVYGDFDPDLLPISDELASDLNDWAGAFTASLNHDDPAVSLWTDEQHRTHAAMARPLAIRLARELPDRTIFVLEGDIGVVEVRGDDDGHRPHSGAGI